MLLQPDRLMTTKAKKQTAPKAPKRADHEAAQRKAWQRELRDFQAAQRRAEKELAQELRRINRLREKLMTQHERDSARRLDRIATLRGRLGL